MILILISFYSCKERKFIVTLRNNGIGVVQFSNRLKLAPRTQGAEIITFISRYFPDEKWRQNLPANIFKSDILLHFSLKYSVQTRQQVIIVRVKCSFLYLIHRSVNLSPFVSYDLDYLWYKATVLVKNKFLDLIDNRDSR